MPYEGPSEEETRKIDEFVQKMDVSDFQIFADYIKIPNELTTELQGTILHLRQKYGVDKWRKVLFAIDALRLQLRWDYSRLQPELVKRLSDGVDAN